MHHHLTKIAKAVKRGIFSQNTPLNENLSEYIEALYLSEYIYIYRGLVPV